MKKFKIICLALILLGAFAVRLYKIDNPIADWHSWRQADTASVSKTYLQHGLVPFIPRYQDISSIQTGIFNPQGLRLVEFPFFNLAHAFMAYLLPTISFDMLGRLLSVACSLVSVFLIFKIGEKYINSLGGLAAAFFFAFIPFNVYFSRTVLPEPMAVMFALFALWLFEKNLVLSAIFLASSILIKPFMAFYALPLIYVVLSKNTPKEIFNNNKKILKYVVFTFLALMPFLVWRVWINQYPAGIPFFTWAFNGDGIRFRPAFWRWIFSERLGNLILGIWGLPLFVLGIFWSKQKSYFTRFFLLGMLFYVVIVATANVRHDYYQVLVIPAICMGLASGVVTVLEQINIRKILAYSGLGFSIAMMMFIGFYQIRGFYEINHPEIIAAGNALDQIAPKDALVIAPYNGDTAFLYQTGRWGWPAVDADITELIRRGASYYVSVNLGDQDTTFIKNHYKVITQTDSYLIADLHQPL